MNRTQAVLVRKVSLREVETFVELLGRPLSIILHHPSHNASCYGCAGFTFVRDQRFYFLFVLKLPLVIFLPAPELSRSGRFKPKLLCGVGSWPIDFPRKDLDHNTRLAASGCMTRDEQVSTTSYTFTQFIYRSLSLVDQMMLMSHL